MHFQTKFGKVRNTIIGRKGGKNNNKKTVEINLSTPHSQDLPAPSKRYNVPEQAKPKTKPTPPAP